MNGLRLCASNQEFSQHLLDTINNGEKFIVWKSFDDHRALSNCELDSLSFVKDDLYINLLLEDEIAIEEIFYFYNEKSSILLKGEVDASEEKRLRIKVTDKKYLKEKRKFKRVEFNTLQIKIQITTKAKSKSDKNRNHEVMISNICEDGVAFLIPKSQSLIFQEDSTLSLNKIERMKLPEEIIGQIKHVTLLEQNQDESGNAQLMVGVRFNKPSKLLKAVIDEVKKSA